MSSQTLEVPIAGMDCEECAAHVEHALRGVAGVESVKVYLAAEKAVLKLDPQRAPMDALRRAVTSAGYRIPESAHASESVATRPALMMLGMVFGVVLVAVIAGEWLGVFERITPLVPWYVGLAVVLLGGYPIFINVIRAALRGQVISHTLMTLGVIAALAVGEWITAAMVVFFMRVGDATERMTTGRARKAVRDLAELAPRNAHVERADGEQDVPVETLRVGEIVVVRPGELIPVDGSVISGEAVVDQAAITGEAMPLEVGAGMRVFAASLARAGSLRVRVSAIGRESTFGRVIQLVEEAEAKRGPVQRLADRFSARYLPVVAVIGLLTLVLRRDPLAAAAVLVVACSCSFALATPIAMLASIGAGARRGLLIKGGTSMEALSRADVVLVDKTGTLTLGQPEIVAIIAQSGRSETELLALAAAAERYSEHPLADAVRRAAAARGLTALEAQDFQATPGKGVRACVAGRTVTVGSRRALENAAALPQADMLEAQGKSLLFVEVDGELAGVLAAADRLREEIPAAFEALRKAGIRHIELLTGDHPAAAAALANPLGIGYRAGLLPEEKIAVVREYQQRGHIVVMVGDGINDAPALAQADVGVAMGAAGTNIAIEAAHIALMREDWMLVPQVVSLARRTMRVVRANLLFTIAYNTLGLTLAALGILPPALAAAAQSLPDIGVLLNSSRLLKA